MTTILLDNGYHPTKIEEELKKIYPEIMTKIQKEIVPKTIKSRKRKRGKIRICTSESQVGNREK